MQYYSLKMLQIAQRRWKLFEMEDNVDYIGIEPKSVKKTEISGKK